jgi:uncharacterized protein
MKKSFFLKALILLFVVIAGYFITAAVFPKNLSRYPFFILLLLTDIYLWSVVKRKIFTYNTVLKTGLALLYWFPFLLLTGTTVVNYFYESADWVPILRIYSYGLIFIFYTAKLIPALILLLTDLIRFSTQLIKYKRVSPSEEKSSELITRSRFIEQLSLATGGLMITTMFAGMLKWVHDFRVKFITIPIKNLPEAFHGYRIVQISDLHLGSWANENQLEHAIDLIHNQNPDLIVFTGDLVNYSTKEAWRFKETLKKLSSKDGVLTILGNHDYGDYMNWPSVEDKKQNMRDLFSFYNEIGWKLLKNSHHIITRNNESLAIIGVENWSTNKRFPKKGNIEKASKGIGQEPVRILLSHDPSHWDVVEQQNPEIQLTLSGHTHGFQFGIDIPGIKWSPAQYMYKRWAGLYPNEDNSRFLYVNRGLGSIGYPGRVGILPEITLIELTS